MLDIQEQVCSTEQDAEAKQHSRPTLNIVTFS